MPELPLEVQKQVKIVKKYKDLRYMSNAEKSVYNRARLQLAVWACKVEGLVPDPANIAAVIGDDAPDVMREYNSIMALNKPSSGDKGAKSSETASSHE